MSHYKFNKGQTVYFLVDPAFYDEECDGEILEGVVIHRSHTDGIEYVLQSSDGQYERAEEDLYATREEVEQAVEAYFIYWRKDAQSQVTEARKQFIDAESYLADLDKRIKRWRAMHRNKEAT